MASFVLDHDEAPSLGAVRFIWSEANHGGETELTKKYDQICWYSVFLIMYCWYIWDNSIYKELNQQTWV